MSKLKSCCVKGCLNKSGDIVEGRRVSMHGFPRDEEYRNHWIVAMRTCNGPQWWVRKDSKVCSLHFRPEDVVHNFGIVRLVQNSVPITFQCLSRIACEDSEEEILPDSVSKGNRLPEVIVIKDEILAETNETSIGCDRELRTVVQAIPTIHTPRSDMMTKIFENVICHGETTTTPFDLLISDVKTLPNYNSSAPSSAKKVRSKNIRYPGDIDVEKLSDTQLQQGLRICKTKIQKQKETLLNLEKLSKRQGKQIQSLKSLVKEWQQKCTASMAQKNKRQKAKVAETLALQNQDKSDVAKKLVQEPCIVLDEVLNGTRYNDVSPPLLEIDPLNLDDIDDGILVECEDTEFL